MRDYAAAGAALGLAWLSVLSIDQLGRSRVLVALPMVTLVFGGGWCGWRTPSGRVAFLGGFATSLSVVAVGALACPFLLDLSEALRAITLALVVGVVPLAVAVMVCGSLGAALRQMLDPTQLVFSVDECPTCGYSLAGTAGARCPECGNIDPLRADQPARGHEDATAS